MILSLANFSRTEITRQFRLSNGCSRPKLVGSNEIFFFFLVVYLFKHESPTFVLFLLYDSFFFVLADMFDFLTSVGHE